MPGRRVVRTLAIAAAPLALGVSALGAHVFGGWATITVDDFPETVTAARPATLSFVVRQHGVTLLGRLSPSVTATDGKSDVTGTVAAGATGHYTSTLVLPRAGDWSVTIHSGFMASSIELPAIRALDARSTPPTTRSPAERGERLFIAKGCVTCHFHAAIAERGYKSIEVGPELTSKRYDADYLRRFLADPSIARTPGRPEMPALGLSPVELAAVTAFINDDRPAAARR